MKYLYIFLGIVSIRFLINLSYFLQIKFYFRCYNKYLENSSWSFPEKRQIVVKLMKKANVEDSFRPRVEPAGYGQLSAGHISVFSNLTVLHEDIIRVVMNKFHEAIGVYRHRMLESFNPRFWLEFLIFLPKHMFLYLGIASDKLVVKGAQLLYWLLASLFGILGISFKPEFTTFIKSIMEKLSQMFA